MENASKALSIAGGILIAMMVISLGVYLFINARDVGTSYEQGMETGEIQKFNSNFISFEGRDDVTIQEIVTIAKFAKQYEEQTEIEVEVIFGVNGDITGKTEKDYVALIQEYSLNNITKEIRYFRCNWIEYDENSGKVNLITFN